MLNYILPKTSKKISNYISGGLRLGIDELISLLPDFTSQATKSVCIIRLDALGDFISWLPVAEILSSYYSNKSIKTVLIANDNWSAFASDLNLFSHVISVNRNRYLNNYFYRCKINLKIKNYSFEIIISPAYDREFYIGDSLVRVAQASSKIGFKCDETDSRHSAISDKWYTDLILNPMKIKHNILLGYAFLDFMNIDYSEKKFGSIKLNKLLENSINKIKEDSYYVIIPGANWMGRAWQIDKWSTLCSLVYQESKMRGVILGSAAEVYLGKKITNASNMLYDLTGKTSIQEMAAIISRAKFIISNETSAIHIAMQLDVPSICILGGGHYDRFLPIPEKISIKKLPVIANRVMPCYGCNWNCQYQTLENEPVRCISEIGIEQVFTILKSSNLLN